MKSMFRYGISAVAFAAATDAGATDYSKVRTHADLDAALGDRAQPEGWADFQVAQKREWLTANPVPAPAKDGEAGAGTTTAPQQVQGEGTTTVAEATAAATTEENQASTTRANDPARDATVSGTTTAEGLEGVQQPPNSNDAGGAAQEPEHNDEQAAGNRHSHGAETEAERSARLAELSGSDLDANAAQAFPAGDDADPAKQPQPGEGPDQRESSQDESGAIQDATRRAIGAGAGAPDGVGDDGTDPSEPEVNDQVDAKSGAEVEPVEVAPGVTFEGGKAKLWGLLEKGATHDDMLKATGYKSALGTIYVMAGAAGRTIDVKKDEKTGTRTYTLQPLPETDASV